jgi:alpha-glucosidase (family GH31 glycosyl hydrolase)
MDKFEKRDIPLSVILLDKDWHIRKTADNKPVVTSFTFNKELIPDPDALIQNIHDRGLKIGLSIDTKDGFHPFDEHYVDAASFLDITDGSDVPINVYNPKQLDAFLKYGLNPLEARGIDFFWNDSKDINDTKRLWVTNYYMFKNLARGQDKRGMILSRNGLIAPHRYPVLYAGESKVGWYNFQSSSFFNLSASNIGACWWSHDIGGFEDGMEESELYIRSVQLGVFSPIMRFHSSGGQYYKREPWKWDAKTQSIVTRYLKLRHQLTPYLYTEAYKYYKTGSMIFQPLYYYIPAVYDDSRYKNEYFFGSELLIAPILTKKNPVMNRTIHKFKLPEGMWYEFTTGKKYVGNKDYVSFYKEDDYPIFARKGSIIPLSLKSNINNTSNPTNIEIHVFPGQNNTYRMYEDDGVSLKYQNGFYLITEIDYNYMPNNYTLILRSVEGKSGIAPDRRNYKIRFRNTRYAEDVNAYFDTTPIEVSKKYIDDNDFVVELENVSTVGQLTINCKGQDIEIDAVRVINEDLDIILSDLQIETKLKEKIAEILFSDDSTKDKRMKITKLKKYNLDKSFIKLFKMIIDYTSEL